MRKKKVVYPTDQTICIDDCECPYCGHKFNGSNACNANMDCQSVECPKCKREMDVSISVEYMCTVIED
jgi:hypothetical protein